MTQQTPETDHQPHYRRQSDILIPLGLIGTVIGIFVSVHSLLNPLITSQVTIAERLATIETKLERMKELEKRIDRQNGCHDK